MQRSTLDESVEKWKSLWNNGTISESTIVQYSSYHQQRKGSVFHLAAASKYLLVLRWSLENCLFRHDIKNDNGSTVLHELVSIENLTPQEVTDFCEIISLFHSDVINLQDKNGKSALHNFIENPNLFRYRQILLTFCSCGASFALSDFQGNTVYSLLRSHSDVFSKDMISLRLLLDVPPAENLVLSGEQRFSLTTAMLFSLLLQITYQYEKLHPKSIETVLRRWNIHHIRYITFESSRCLILQVFKAYILLFIDTENNIPLLANELTSKSFSKLWKSIFDSIRPESNLFDIFLAGHSLGGCLATLSALEFSQRKAIGPQRVHVYTFGSPRIGNSIIRKKIDQDIEQAFVIVREEDLAPHLPLHPSLAHCGTMRLITKDGFLFNDQHYQFQDIRRRFLSQEQRNPHIQEIQLFRYNWSQGLFLLQEQNDQKPLAHATGDSSPRITNDSEITGNDLLSYISDISKLVKLINHPIGSSSRYLTSNISEISVASDLWDARIKGIRHQREAEGALLQWIRHFTEGIPQPFSYSIDAPSSLVLEWFEDEKRTLLSLQSLFEQLGTSISSVSFSLAKFHQETTLQTKIGALSTIALLEFIDCVESISDRTEKCRKYQKLLSKLPKSGYALLPRSNASKLMPTVTLTEKREPFVYYLATIELIETYYVWNNINNFDMIRFLHYFPSPGGVRYQVLKQQAKQYPCFLKKARAINLSATPRDPTMSIITKKGTMNGVLSKPILQYRDEAIRNQQSKKKESLTWTFPGENGAKYVVHENPSHPAMERAAFLLASRISGTSVCPCFLGKINFPPLQRGKKSIQCIPILLQTFPEHSKPLDVSQIDEYYLASLFVFSILALPTSGNAENIIMSDGCASVKNAFPCLVPVDPKESLLYSYPFDQRNFMDKEIHPFVIRQFLALNVEETLLSWLCELSQETHWCYNINNKERIPSLFTDKELMACDSVFKNECGDKYTVSLFALFHPNATNEMYIRMRTLQSYWKRSNARKEPVTYQQTLTFVLPVQPTPSPRKLVRETSLRKLKRASEGTETPVSQMETLLTYIRALHNGDTSNFSEIFQVMTKKNKKQFRKLFSKLGLPFRELFLQSGYPNYCRESVTTHPKSTRAKWEQMVLQEVMNYTDWTHLHLIRFEYLDDASLHHILSVNNNVEKLILHGCTGITQLGLAKNPPKVSKLYEIDLRETPCIGSIHIDAPSIDNILIDPVPSIKAAPNQAQVNLMIFGDYCENQKRRLWESFTGEIDADDSCVVHLQGKDICVKFFDTTGDEKRPRFTQLEDISVFILYFSVNDESSLLSVKEKWSDVQTLYPTVPIILLCTQIADYSDSFRIPVQKRTQLATDLNVSAYFECSTQNPQSVIPAFNHAILLATQHCYSLPSLFQKDNPYFSKCTQNDRSIMFPLPITSIDSAS